MANLTDMAAAVGELVGWPGVLPYCSDGSPEPRPFQIPRGGWQLLRQYVPPGGLAQFIREHKQFQLKQVTQTIWEFGFAQDDISLSDPAEIRDTPGGLAPGSASAASSQAEGLGDDVSPLDLAELQLFIEWLDDIDDREIVRHKCVHGEWLRRPPRPLSAGHALCMYDSSPDTTVQSLPDCCKIRPREEKYDVDRKQWLVWQYEEGWIDEDIFYQWVDLD